ncbi:pisatin demethylase [Daldinia caldariorum]|uniref:pisatin demethylase n=1 Tax=Daldinia caldariorum TaxID=326644 RepID=UPI0020081518|nr:pisatin demethylase [Daldinia caldariorum]KAI1468859.1 pisatin demethylase [Daldinia caldariorum]
MTLLIYVAVTCLLVVWVTNVLLNWYRLRHIPGSFWISSTKAWQVTTQIRGKWYLELRKLGDQYGDLFRIGPNQLMTTDIEVIHRMAHIRSAYTRAPFYQTFRFNPTQDNSFSLLDDREHTRRRTILGQGYTGNAHVEASIDRQCARLVDLIERKFVSTSTEYRPMDLTAVSFFFSMDCVGDLSYGRPFGCLDDGQDVHKFIKWNENFFNTAIVISNFNWLTKIFFKPPFNKIYPSSLDVDGVGRIMALAQAAVERSIADDEDRRKDALGSFLEHGITREEAVNELMLQVVAGTDSTAAGIRMTILLLVANPVAYNKLKAEIDDGIAKGNISSPIKDAESRHLPYLQAVIKEGLRTFPVVTATFFKKVPEGGDTIGGHFVPEGTEVGHNVLGVMRAKKYWGDDADVFRPERWLEADKNTFDMMADVLETLWGSGRYKCLGRTVAQMELNKVFVELLRRFDFSIVTPQNPVEIVNSGFFLMSEMKMRVTRREAVVKGKET